MPALLAISRIECPSSRSTHSIDRTSSGIRIPCRDLGWRSGPRLLETAFFFRVFVVAFFLAPFTSEVYGGGRPYKNPRAPKIDRKSAGASDGETCAPSDSNVDTIESEGGKNALWPRRYTVGASPHRERWSGKWANSPHREVRPGQGKERYTSRLRALFQSASGFNPCQRERTTRRIGNRFAGHLSVFFSVLSGSWSMLTTDQSPFFIFSILARS